MFTGLIDAVFTTDSFLSLRVGDAARGPCRSRPHIDFEPSMPIEIIHRYSREDLSQPGQALCLRRQFRPHGHGGQARETRGEPNAIGIGTKKAPTYDGADFLTDGEYAQDVHAILADFERFFGPPTGPDGRLAGDGIGTGIAQLPARAPLTLRFINTLIDSLKQVYGVTNSTNH